MKSNLKHELHIFRHTSCSALDHFFCLILHKGYIKTYYPFFFPYSNPLLKYKSGDIIIARVIGRHNTKTHKFLPISHAGGI